jgi:hypothetical protein
MPPIGIRGDELERPIDLAPVTSREEAALIQGMGPTCAMESTVAQSKSRYW